MSKKSVIGLIVLFAVIIGAMCALIPVQRQREFDAKWGRLAPLYKTDSRIQYVIDHEELYLAGLIDYLRDNSLDDEYIDWVRQYPAHKDDYYSGWAYSDEELSGAPLYMDDTRWCYQTIGGGYIRLDGCGCVSLTMAYISQTGSGDYDPYTVALAAEQAGALGIFGGMEATMVGDVCAAMGLNCLSSEKFFNTAERFGTPDADDIKTVLDAGHACMLSLSGETFGGHALIVRAYDNSGFYLNDPASRENSERVWTFDELRDEIVMIYDISV